MQSSDPYFSTTMMADICCTVSASHVITRRVCAVEDASTPSRGALLLDTSTPHNDAIVSESSVVKPSQGWVTLHTTECLRSGLHEWSVRVEQQGDTSDGSGLMLGILPKTFHRYDSFISQGGGWCISRAGKFYGLWKRIDNNPITALSFGTGDRVVFELDVEAGRMTVRVGDRFVIGEISNMPNEVYPAVSLHYRHQHVVFEQHTVKERQPKRRGWFQQNSLSRVAINIPFQRVHSEVCLAQLLSSASSAFQKQTDSPLENMLQYRLCVLHKIFSSIQQNMEGCIRLHQFLPLATTPEVLREQLNPATLPNNSVQALALSCGFDIIGILLKNLDPSTSQVTLGFLEQYLQQVILGGISEREHAKPNVLTPKVITTLKQMLLNIYQEKNSMQALSILIQLALARASLNDVFDVIRLLFSLNIEIPISPLVRKLLDEPVQTFDLPPLLLSDTNRWETKRSENFQVHAMASDGAFLFMVTTEGLCKVALGANSAQPLRFQLCVPPPMDFGTIGVSCCVIRDKVLISSKTLLLKKGIAFMVMDKELKLMSDVPFSTLGLGEWDFTVQDFKIVQAEKYLLAIIGQEAGVVRREDKDNFPPSHHRVGRTSAFPVNVFKLDSETFRSIDKITLRNEIVPMSGYSHPIDVRKCLFLGKEAAIDFGPPMDLDFPGGALTIEFWLRVLGREDGKSLFVMGDRTVSGEIFIDLQMLDSGLYLKAGMRIETRTNSKSVTAVTMFPQDYLNTWTHISVSFDGIWSIHINGCLCAVSLPSAGVPGVILERPRKKMVLGAGCIGYVSEFRIWKGGRPISDLQRDIFRSLTGSEVGLALYCRIDDGAGHTIYDMCSHHHGWVTRTTLPAWRFLSDFPFVPNTTLAAHLAGEKRTTHFCLPSVSACHFYTNGSQLGVLIPKCEDTTHGKKNGVTFAFDLSTGLMLRNEHIVMHQVDGPICVSPVCGALWFMVPSDRAISWISLCYPEAISGHSDPENLVVVAPSPRANAEDISKGPFPCSRDEFLLSSEMKIESTATTIQSDVLAARLIVYCDMCASVYPEHGPITFFSNMSVDVSASFLQNLHRTIGDHYKEMGVAGRRSSILRGRKSPYIVAACLRILRLQLALIRRSGVNPATLNLTLHASSEAERTLGSRLYTILCEIWNDSSVPQSLRYEAQKCVTAGIALFYPDVETKVDAILRLASATNKISPPSTEIALRSLLTSLSEPHNALTLVKGEVSQPTKRLQEIAELLLALSVNEIFGDIEQAAGKPRVSNRTATNALNAILTAMFSVMLPINGNTPFQLDSAFQLPETSIDTVPMNEVVLNFFATLVHAVGEFYKKIIVSPTKDFLEALLQESVFGAVLTQVLNSLLLVVPHPLLGKFIPLLAELQRHVTNLCKHFHPAADVSSVVKMWNSCVEGTALNEKDSPPSFFVFLKVLVVHVTAALAYQLTKPIPSAPESISKETCGLVDSDLFSGGVMEDQSSESNVSLQIAMNVGLGKEIWTKLRSGPPSSSNDTDHVLRAFYATVLHFSPDIVSALRTRIIKECPVDQLLSIEGVQGLHRKIESIRTDVIVLHRDVGDKGLNDIVGRCMFLLQFLPMPDPSAHTDVLKSVFTTSFNQASKAVQNEVNPWKGIYKGWQKVKTLQRLLHMAKTSKGDLEATFKKIHEFVFRSTAQLSELREILAKRRELGSLRATGIECIRNLASTCPELQNEIVGLLLRGLRKQHYLEGIRSCGLPICNSVQHFMYNLLKETLPKLSAPETPTHFKLLLLSSLKAPWKSYDYAFLHGINTVQYLYETWSRFPQGSESFIGDTNLQPDAAMLRKAGWEAMFALALGCILNDDGIMDSVPTNTGGKFVGQCFAAVRKELQHCLAFNTLAGGNAVPDAVTQHCYDVLTHLSILVKSIPPQSSCLLSNEIPELVAILESVVASSALPIIASEIPRCALSVLNFLLPNLNPETLEVGMLERGASVMVCQFLLDVACGVIVAAEVEPLTGPLSCDAIACMQSLIQNSSKWSSAISKLIIPYLQYPTHVENHVKHLAALRVVGGFVHIPTIGDHTNRVTLNTGGCWDNILQPSFIVDMKLTSGMVTLISSDYGIASDEKDWTIDALIPASVSKTVTENELVFFPHIFEALKSLLALSSLEGSPFEKSTKKALPLVIYSFHLLRCLVRFLTNVNCAKEFASSGCGQGLCNVFGSGNAFSCVPVNLQDYHCAVLYASWMRQQSVGAASPKATSIHSDSWILESSRKQERRNSSLVDHLVDVWESEMQHAAQRDNDSWKDKIRQGPPPDGLHYCLMFMNPTGSIDFSSVSLDTSRGFSVEVIVCLTDSSHCLLWNSLMVPSRWDSAQFDYVILSAWDNGAPSFGLKMSQKGISFGVFGQDEAVCVDVRSQDFERWVHLVGTFDGDQWCVYKDGECIATAAAKTAINGEKAGWKMGGVSSTQSEAYLAVAALRMWQHPLHRSHVQSLSERAHSGDMTVPSALSSKGCVFFPLCEGSSNVVTCENGVVDGYLGGPVVWAPTESIAICSEEDLRTLDDITTTPNGNVESIPWMQWMLEANATQRDNLSQVLCRHMVSACTAFAKESILTFLNLVMTPCFDLVSGAPIALPQLWPIDGNLPLALSNLVKFSSTSIEDDSFRVVKQYIERLMKAYNLQGEKQVSLFTYLFVQHCILLLDEPDDVFTVEFASPSTFNGEPILTPVRINGVGTCKLTFDTKCKNLDSMTIFSDSAQKSQIARCPDTQGSWSDVDIQSSGWMYIRRNCSTHNMMTNGQRVSFRIKSPRFAVITGFLHTILKVAGSDLPSLLPIVCGSIPLCSLISVVHKEHGERRLHAAAVVTSLLQLWARHPAINKHDQVPTYFILDRVYSLLSQTYLKEHNQGTMYATPSRLFSKFVQCMTELAVAGQLAESSWFKTTLKSQVAHRFFVISHLYDSSMYKPVEHTTPELPALGPGATYVSISDKKQGKWLCSSERLWQVIRCNAGMYRGRWYCEARVPPSGVMSVGLVTSQFKGSDHAANCPLGQCSQSWSYDGGKLCRWYGGVRHDYGGRLKWKPRDVIGMSFDLEEGTLSFYHNGKYAGVAFSDLPVKKNLTFHAAISIYAGHGACEWNFGRASFVHEIPSSHLPIDREYFRLPPFMGIHRVLALVEIASAVSGSQGLPPYFKSLGDDYFASIRDVRDGPDVVELSTYDGKPKMESLSVRSQGIQCTVRANVRVRSGKWYYEAVVMQEGCMTIGWSDDVFAPDSNRGKGVGDDMHSWGFDGHRVIFRTNKHHSPFSRRRWKEGDVIGCMIDLDEKIMQFSLNGDLLRDTTSDLNLTPFTLQPGAGWLTPTASLDAETALSFVFNGNDMTYLPSMYNPIGWQSVIFQAVDSYYFGPEEDSVVSKQWPLGSAYVQDRLIVKFLNQTCDDQQIPINQLDLVNSLQCQGSSTVPLPLRQLIADDDAMFKFARRVTFLKHINNLLFSLQPLFNPELDGPVANAFLSLRNLLFSTSSRAGLQRYITASNGNGELIKITINRRTQESSVFQQVFSLLGEKSSSLFWTAKKLWSVSLAGEGAEDVGGPYRESLSDMCRDLMSTGTPLFIPSSNQTQNDGEYRDRWIVNPKATEPAHMAMFNFLGRLMGGCLRSNEPLALYLISILWKKLVGERITTEDFTFLDISVSRSLQFLLEAEKQGFDKDTFHNVYEGTFVTIRSDGVECELCQGGKNIPVTFDTRNEFVALVQDQRVHGENRLQHEAILSGFRQVVPRHVVSLLRWEELERYVCGRPDFNVEELMSGARFENITPDDIRVKYLKQILTEFSPSERALFMKFVSGRERLPAGIRLKIMSGASKDGHDEDSYLPHASTCFYWITLPRYSSMSVMKEKLLYAVQHCVDIDADFRVRDDREGEEGPRVTVTDNQDDDDFEDYSHLL